MKNINKDKLNSLTLLVSNTLKNGLVALGVEDSVAELISECIYEETEQFTSIALDKAGYDVEYPENRN